MTYIGYYGTKVFTSFKKKMPGIFEICCKILQTGFFSLKCTASTKCFPLNLFDFEWQKSRLSDDKNLPIRKDIEI